VTLSRDLEQPWSLAFLPDGRMLITERPGRLRLFAGGKLERTPLPGVPKVHVGGQAGLLDVCLHPRFAENRVLYLSYLSPGSGGPTATVARAELANDGLRGTTVIFEALPRRQGNLNLGSRIVFDRAGLMYVSCGDRFQMELAQDLADCAGKIVRLRDDGSVPAENPFVGKPKARPEIFSTTTRHLPGMEDALRTWVPSISPCGLTFYTGDRFPGWKGSLFTGALSAYALFRIEVDGERYVSEERLIEGRLPYIRDVRQGPDGLLYLVTHSDDGGLFRLEPA